MYKLAKRLFDIIASLCTLTLCLPLMGIIALAIRIESKGPALFKQQRAGYRGKPFQMYKFRSMKIETFSYGRSPEGSDDPRLTKVGRLLRETSLDELPQLFNVLFGKMSLVGPRPLYERQAQQWDENQRRRLDVPPGITGWAQIHGRGEIPIEEKIELDLWYVDNCSFILDIKILLGTVFQGLKPGGNVYEKKYSNKQHRERY